MFPLEHLDGDRKITGRKRDGDTIVVEILPSH
jgi:hypothetical protein